MMMHYSSHLTASLRRLLPSSRALSRLVAPPLLHGLHLSSRLPLVTEHQIKLPLVTKHQIKLPPLPLLSALLIRLLQMMILSIIWSLRTCALTSHAFS